MFALVAVAACDKAPYAPSGYKPAKAFLLPLRQAAAAAAPAPSAPYTAPSAFSAPAPFTAPSAFSAPIYPYVPVESFEAANARQEVETIATPAPRTEKKEAEVGQYYILSPEGRLQKVEYFTAAQPQSEFAQQYNQYNPSRSAKVQQFKGGVSNFQYRDVEPISAPIYSYTNVPGPLVRILRQAEDF